MTVEILKPEKFEKWNEFVDISPQGDLFCYSWWLDTITRSNFKILAAIMNDQIVAGIPMALDDLNRITEPPLTRTLGVLFRPQPDLSIRNRRSAERKMLSELLTHLPLNDFVQTCTHHTITDWLPFRWIGLHQTTRYTYILDYSERTVDDLWAMLDHETRTVIRRASERGLIVDTTDEIGLVYKYQSLSLERQGVHLSLRESDFLSLDRAIVKNGSRTIFKAYDAHNTVHAVVYVVSSSKSAYTLMSGSDPELRQLGGHTLVLWEAIKYFSGKTGYFNFGGSDIQGIESHFRTFGATQTPYFHIYSGDMNLKRTDMRYHLKRIGLHIIELTRILRARVRMAIRTVLI
jgi:hypothetical protein